MYCVLCCDEFLPLSGILCSAALSRLGATLILPKIKEFDLEKMNIFKKSNSLIFGIQNLIRYSSSKSADEIKKLVASNKVVVFMKGVPEQPQCGFSNAVVQILRMHGVNYDSHNVLKDESLRQGIKEFSNWPTIPQVFINGEFVGGCDIMLQMHQSGDLIEELEKVGIKSALLDQKNDEKDSGSKS